MPLGEGLTGIFRAPGRARSRKIPCRTFLFLAAVMALNFMLMPEGHEHEATSGRCVVAAALVVFEGRAVALLELLAAAAWTQVVPADLRRLALRRDAHATRRRRLALPRALVLT